jgi:flagellin-like protein
MNQSIKSKRSAISPIIATLLLILIAIAAGVIVYAYVTGFIGNTTGNSSGINTISPDQLYVTSTAGAIPVNFYVRNQGPSSENFNTGFALKSSSLDDVLVPAVVVKGSGTTDTITEVQFLASGSNFQIKVFVTCAATTDTITMSFFGTSTTSANCGTTSATTITTTVVLPTGVTASSSIAGDSGAFAGVNVGSTGINSGKGDVVGVGVTGGQFTVAINTVVQLTLSTLGSLGTSSLTSSGTTYTVYATGTDGASTSAPAKSS